MSASLQTGQFYGRSQQKLESSGVVLTELQHKTGRKLPQHTHESAYFSLLLRGSYSEYLTSRNTEYVPFSIGFHPPSLTHKDEVGPGGTLMFCIELREEFLSKTRPYLQSPSYAPDLCGSDMTWLGLRLYKEFRKGVLGKLGLEEFCMDMLERAVQVAPREEKSKPFWLHRAEELLRERFREPLTLEEVAREVGVHPIHLSRVFRKKHRCTMGEFLNRLRVRFACAELAKEGAQLGDVAMEAGFSDQSHFGRVLRSLTGETPGSLRALTLSLPSLPKFQLARNYFR